MKNEKNKIGKFSDVIVLYVGAAPGIHTSLLIKMFPNYEYHLYDKTKFDDNLYNYKQVKIYNEYFDNSKAEKYRGKNVVFISDIRNLEIGKIDKGKNIDISNKIVYEDMNLQKEWYDIMKPITALLHRWKFKMILSGSFYKFSSVQEPTEFKMPDF